MGITAVMIFATVIVGLIFETDLLITSIVAAAIGGFFHEIVQSGGSVAYPQLKQDGLYFGSLTGLIFGGIAGMLAVQALPANPTVGPGFIPQMFFAGLALKGVAEAPGALLKPQA